MNSEKPDDVHNDSLDAESGSPSKSEIGEHKLVRQLKNREWTSDMLVTRSLQRLKVILR
jgi:hypothetical protein